MSVKCQDCTMSFRVDEPNGQHQTWRCPVCKRAFWTVTSRSDCKPKAPAVSKAGIWPGDEPKWAHDPSKIMVA